MGCKGSNSLWRARQGKNKSTPDGPWKGTWPAPPPPHIHMATHTKSIDEQTTYAKPCTHTSTRAKWPTLLVTRYDRLRESVGATGAEVAEDDSKHEDKTNNLAPGPSSDSEQLRGTLPLWLTRTSPPPLPSLVPKVLVTLSLGNCSSGPGGTRTTSAGCTVPLPRVNSILPINPISNAPNKPNLNPPWSAYRQPPQRRRENISWDADDVPMR